MVPLRRRRGPVRRFSCTVQLRFVKAMLQVTLGVLVGASRRHLRLTRCRLQSTNALQLIRVCLRWTGRPVSSIYRRKNVLPATIFPRKEVRHLLRLRTYFAGRKEVVFRSFNLRVIHDLEKFRVPIFDF